MRKRLAILLIGVSLLFGCASASWQSVCRHNAVVQTLVVGEQHPVRIVTGPTRTPGIWHAQGQVFLEKEWKYLGNDGLGVFVAEKDWWFEPERVYTVEEFIKEVWK